MLREYENLQVVKFREKLTLLRTKPSICHWDILNSCFFLKSVTKSLDYTERDNRFDKCNLSVML